MATNYDHRAAEVIRRVRDAHVDQLREDIGLLGEEKVRLWLTKLAQSAEEGRPW